jgi:hypothetical protein
MLKIKNVSKLKGVIVNGCRVLDIEYSSESSGYIFTMEDTHNLNSENTGQFLIKLLDSNYETKELIPNRVKSVRDFLLYRTIYFNQ